MRLAARITALFVQELRRAWRPVLELELSVERVESNPHLVQIVAPGEVVMVSRFGLGLNDSRGTISLSIPCRALQQIVGNSGYARSGRLDLAQLNLVGPKDFR